MEQNTRAKWPEPPKSLAERILHVIDMFEGQPGSMRVVTATTGIYAQHSEEHSWTGLTLEDIRALGLVVLNGLHPLDGVDEESPNLSVRDAAR